MFSPDPHGADVETEASGLAIEPSLPIVIVPLTVKGAVFSARRTDTTT